MRITTVAEAVILAWGWRRRLIAFAAGASGALALPPLDLWPLVVLPMSFAIWLMDGAVGATRWQRFRSAFMVGWWWGFGFFVAGLWWLGAAFLVEADKFAWAMPLGVVALPAFLAVFPAFAFGAARLFWPKGAGRILVLAAMLGISEWLRGHVLTGFPWNAYGMMLTGEVHLEQVASLFGLYGLTLFAVAIGAAPAALGTATTSSGRWLPSLLALAALVGFFAYGFWRVPAGPAPLVAGVKLRLGDDFGSALMPHGDYGAELEFYVDYAGIPALDVIRWATRYGAELMGHDGGAVRPGAVADLLVLDGDPLNDIKALSDTSRILAILKGGVFQKNQMDSLARLPIERAVA